MYGASLLFQILRMKIAVIEFKVQVKNLNQLQNKLVELHPLFIGEDHQIDTYFKVVNGRLKLREGTIENALIYYERSDAADSKQSNVLLYKHTTDLSLKEILCKLHGVKVIVDKMRKIYFIDNVKFHFDTVDGLGTFMEVEAIDETGEFAAHQLKEQCDKYFSFFGFNNSDYVSCSYSDLLLAKPA